MEPTEICQYDQDIVSVATVDPSLSVVPGTVRMSLSYPKKI